LEGFVIEWETFAIDLEGFAIEWEVFAIDLEVKSEEMIKAEEIPPL
jgi:hypothetical protein